MIAPLRSSLSRDAQSHRVAKFDFYLLASVIVLISFGLLALYSQGYGSATSNFKPQLVRLGIGVIPFVVFWKVPIDFWRKSAKTLYIVNVTLLGLVLVAGVTNKGAQRWLQIGPIEFQPSELSKLLIVLTLAAFFASRLDEVNRVKTFVLSLLHIAPVAALVYKQPHLGATLVILVAWLAVCIASGVRWKILIGAVVAICGLLVIAYNTPGVLDDYQRERIVGMFEKDEQDSGFQQLRATIAISSGGVFGQGFLKGEQKAGRYIPDQHTDFVFTILAEELGLVGSALVLAGFAFFFYRVWLIMFHCEDSYARIVAAGIFSILAFHMVVNIGMNLSILPVVGLWLPFLSYGGSALWLCLSCVGLLLNIASGNRRMFS